MHALTLFKYLKVFSVSSQEYDAGLIAPIKAVFQLPPNAWENKYVSFDSL